jgi:hypothetical protein
MPISPEVKEQRLVAPKSTAAAFIEDMAYFRELLNRKEIDSSAIRRSSNELRRILIDNGGDLEKIAAPRIGRVHLTAPYNNPYYRFGEKHPFAFFASGGVTLFGATFRGICMRDGRPSAPDMSKHPPDVTEQFTTDGFLSQKVLCLNGIWSTRRSLIKYVAHVSHGVHSGAATDEHEKQIERMRRVVTFGSPPDAPFITINQDALLDDKEVTFRYEPKAIDAALMELLAAIHWLCESPKLIELESAIREELASCSY